MIGTLPHGVSHMFSVKLIGKSYAACCKQCSYRVNFTCFPVTPLTHARLARHVDYHSTCEDWDARYTLAEPPVAYDGPES
jgi:hypothetical protein